MGRGLEVRIVNRILVIIHNVQYVWLQYVLLHFAEGTAKKSIIWYRKLSFVCGLWIDNPDIRFLTKIP